MIYIQDRAGDLIGQQFPGLLRVLWVTVAGDIGHHDFAAGGKFDLFQSGGEWCGGSGHKVAVKGGGNL